MTAEWKQVGPYAWEAAVPGGTLRVVHLPIAGTWAPEVLMPGARVSGPEQRIREEAQEWCERRIEQ